MSSFLKSISSPVNQTTSEESGGRGLSLKTKLTGVMLLTISAIAAIVHFPWAITSRQNVNDMVSQLNEELIRGTQNEVSNLFGDILASQQLIKSSLDNKIIELNEPNKQGIFYLNMLLANENFTWVQFGFANGDYVGAQRRPDGLYSIIRRQWDDTLGVLGAPESELIQKQVERAQLAEIYQQNQEWNSESDIAQKTVETFRFSQNQNLEKINESQSTEVYYAPIRPFYEVAIANPGEPVWTDVYVFRTGNAVGLDASTTYQSLEDRSIRGVISISFEIRQISAYLASLKENDEDISQGAVFIIDSEGKLIAASNPEALENTFTSDQSADLMSISDVNDPMLQIAYESFRLNEVNLGNLSGLQEISYYDSNTRQRYYVAVQPLGELDWFVGTVTPESVFLQRINRSKRRLLIVIILFLGLGSVTAVWLSDRTIARPILAITDAAEAIEAGNFYAVSLDETSQRKDELGKLSQVFQTMAKEVYAREQNLKQQLQALKIEIDESRKEREVKEIVETDFFRDLKIKAQNLRNRTSSASDKGEPKGSDTSS